MSLTACVKQRLNLNNHHDDMYLYSIFGVQQCIVVCQHQVNATYAGSYTGPMPPRGGTKWPSTGLWAPAGQPITVTISSTVAATLSASGGILGVQIGSHSDNLSAKTSWCRWGER